MSWFEKKYKNKRKMPYPHSFTDYIYHKDMWNHHELAVHLNIEEEQLVKYRSYFMKYID